MRRGSVVACAVAAVLAAGPRTAAGQDAQGWTAQLVLSPLPSPYLSDWEVDPTVGELIVTNSTATTTDITFHYTLTRGGHLLLRGVTDAQTVPAGQSETFNGSSTFGGSADWDRDAQDLVTRTGRLPEGDYEACVTITDPGGFVLVERQCVQFSAQYPDPPSLVFPMSGDTITTQDPIFEWLPVDLPPLAGGRLGYVLQIAEVNTEAGQRPETALESNIAHFVEPDLVGTTQQYPVGALPFVSGHTYAWRVQALDGEGLPVAANQGRSEVWTFIYAEPAVDVDRPVASIALTPRRDTLRYAGDTTLFEAQAFDADNVVIPGKRFQWRSADTAVARVDSAGVVTGVGGGETRIVASVGGVADSAFSVTAVASGLSLHFERYDATTDQPSLLQVIQSGPPEAVVPKLMALLQSGEFRIPIPRLPGVPGNDGNPGELDTGGAQQGGDTDGGGPRLGDPNVRWGGPVDEQCSNITVPAQASYDAARKVFVVPFRDDAKFVVKECVHADLDSVMVVDSTPVAGPPECTPGGGGRRGGSDTTGASCPPPGSRWDVDTTYTPDTTYATDSTVERGALFVVSWAHPGLPRVFVVFKGQGGLDLPGTELRARYWVVNLLRTTTVGSDALPEAYSHFFGSDSFDAGVGLTIYVKRRCPNSSGGLCPILTRINPTNPEVTLQMFAGVTASEVSAGSGGLGASLALGFSIQATLPVRTWDFDIGALSIDSTQVGLLFAVQDSMVAGGKQRDNWSIGVAPTLAIWLTGSRGNQWEVDGSVGLEWDPTAGKKPKLVVSAQLPQIWQLWWLRLGNPALVFTTPIGSREEREATTLALSGTWGFGPNNGIGIADSASGGGNVRGDIGGGATGGQTGFEEMGHGQITFTWARPPSEQTRDAAKQKRDSAMARVTRQLHVVRDARANVEQARRDREVALHQSEEDYQAADSAFWAANQVLAKAQATLDGWRRERDQARAALAPPKCWKQPAGRCLNWAARLSAGNGAIADLIVKIFRLLGENP